MTETATDFLFNYTETVSVPDHLPLVCLTLYLFLDFNDDKHRLEQLKTLFYNYKDADYYKELEKTIQQDKAEAEFLKQAVSAAIDGQIEQYHADHDFQRFEKTKPDTTEFYTVSFLAWAESIGHKIPDYITKEMQAKIQYYFMSKNSRDGERLEFPEITRHDVERLTSEPLWKMTDALLHALGHKSLAPESKKADFLRYKSRAKRLTDYALDAHKAHDLKLYGFDDHAVDADQKDIEEKRLQSFYASKVKPRDFLDWLHGLGLDIPILQGKPDDTLDAQITAGGYSTPYIDLMMQAIRELNVSKDNQPPVKHIREWLEKQNIDLSKREKDYLATFLRLPAMKKGGFHGGKK